MPKLAGLSQSERAVVEQLSTRLVNKLLHTPTLRLRETAGRGQEDCLGAHVRQASDLENGADPDGDSAPSETDRRP